MKNGSVVMRIIIYTALTIGAFFMVVPFLWMLSTAFKTPAELNIWPPTFIPKQLQFDNFRAVFAAAPIHRYFMNSLGMATISTVSIMFTSTLSGYIFAKFRMFGLNILFATVLATAIVPFEVYMIPLYTQMQSVNMINTFTGLVFPYLVMSFGIFFMRQNILSLIPDELLESARVEGASEWRIFFTIVMPLCTSPMSALGIFAFIEAWNAFVWPLLIVGNSTLYTMELGLAMFQSSFGIDMTVVSAGSLLSILPIVIVYAFLRRNIIESVSLSGIK